MICMYIIYFFYKSYTLYFSVKYSPSSEYFTEKYNASREMIILNFV